MNKLVVVKLIVGICLLLGTSLVWAGSEWNPPGMGTNTGNLVVQIEKGIVYLGIFIYLIYAFAAACGVWFIMSGVTGWKKESEKGEHGQADYKKHVIKVISGAILVGFTTWVGIIHATSTSTNVSEHEMSDSGF